MAVHRKVALLVCMLLLGCPLGSARAQEPAAPAPETGAGEEGEELEPIPRLLKELKEAPPYEASKVRTKIVREEAEAVPYLVKEVRAERGSPQTRYVAHCLLALGEIGDERAKDVLLEELANSHLAVAYQAAVALGRVFAGKGSERNRVLDINADLLATLHSGWPPVARRGPALALVSINKIPIILDRNQPPASAPAATLARHIDMWFERNQDALPDLPRRPWQINLRTVETTGDASLRSRAAESLITGKRLEPIESILEMLDREGEAAVKRDVREELVRVLFELSGVPYPPSGMKPEQRHVERWRELWYGRLRGMKGSSHVAYSWWELENTFRRFRAARDDKTAQRLKELRTVLAHQLRQPSEIPGGASAEARELMVPPLESKQRIREALERFAQAAEAIQREIALQGATKELEEGVAKDKSLEIGMQFLQQIVNLAGAEKVRSFARRMGDALGTITEVPCLLDAATLEDRQKALAEWIKFVRGRGLQLELPAALQAGPAGEAAGA